MSQPEATRVGDREMVRSPAAIQKPMAMAGRSPRASEGDGESEETRRARRSSPARDPIALGARSVP